jgi:hypothetical protein
MSYKIEKECEPCIVCNYTGWKLITDCRCDHCNSFQDKNMKSLLEYWRCYHGDKVELRLKIDGKLVDIDSIINGKVV